MRKTYLYFVLFCFAFSCSLPNKKIVSTESGSNSSSVHILDSLKKDSDLGELTTRVYSGKWSTTANETEQYSLTLYNYVHSGDGVYSLKAISPHRKSISEGRLYTLRGDADNDNATVYQLNPFYGNDILYFRYEKDKLVLLNKDLKRDTLDIVLWIAK